MCLMPQLNLKENLDILSKDIQLCEKLFIEAFNRKFKKSLYTTFENENATSSSREVDANASSSSSRMPSVMKNKGPLFTGEISDTKEINVFENGDGSLKVIVERNPCLHHHRSQSANNLYVPFQCSEKGDNKRTSPSQRSEKEDNLRTNELKTNEMTEKRPQLIRPKSRSSSPKQSWGQLLEKQSTRSHSTAAKAENHIPQQSVKIGSTFLKKQEYKTQLPNNLKSFSTRGSNARQPIGKAPPLNNETRSATVQSKKLLLTKAATELKSSEMGYKKELPILVEHSSRSSEVGSSARTRSSTIYTSDNPDNIDRSIQCVIINGKCSTEQDQTEQHRTIDNFIGETGGAFAMFNPVRTLNFLIKELQGITQKNSDSKINRIIADMEQTLSRIPSETDSVDLRRHTDGGHTYCQHARCAAPPLTLPTDLQYELKLTIERMEKTSQQMQATCDHLREQRDKLQVALKEKEAELDSIKRQDQTHEGALLRLETDLATVSHKAEEYCNTISELSEIIFKLKKENKELVGYRDAHKKIAQLLHESEQKTEQLNTQLQLAEISKEKLNAQLAARDMELKSCKEQVADMKSLILHQLKSLKSSVRLGGSSNSSSDKGDSALPSARPLCSSPTSSANSSLLGISPSWQKISSIPVTTPTTAAAVQPTYEDSETQEFITLGGNANPSTVINLSNFAFKSLEADSGVGNEVPTPPQAAASVEKVDSRSVKQTESDACLGNQFQMMFNRLQRKTLQLGSDINLPEPPKPYEAIVPKPAGLSQVSAVTDTDMSLNYAALSDPDTTFEAEDSKSKELESVIDRFL